MTTYCWPASAPWWNTWRLQALRWLCNYFVIGLKHTSSASNIVKYTITSLLSACLNRVTETVDDAVGVHLCVSQKLFIVVMFSA
mmetsp:Transcript_3797/g.8508  ORF Transcript_3797/g.8508 Transcript_3797/m.8508 type:complete len:84 (+) Transcript_3797:1272-1523(+)